MVLLTVVVTPAALPTTASLTPKDRLPPLIVAGCEPTTSRAPGEPLPRLRLKPAWLSAMGLLTPTRISELTAVAPDRLNEPGSVSLTTLPEVAPVSVVA